MAATLRKRVEVLSAPTLIRLHSLPRAVMPVLILLFMFVGLMKDNAIGGIALLIVTAFVGWLLYLSWPLLEGRARIIRALAVSLVFAAALSKFVGT
jgi:hypothetical protein